MQSPTTDSATRMAPAVIIGSPGPPFEPYAASWSPTEGIRVSEPAALQGMDAKAAAEYVKEQIEAGQIEAAREFAEQAHGRFPDQITLNDHLIALRRHFGDPKEALELAILNAQRHRDRLEKRREQKRPERPLDPDQRLFLSGYFYSGSGAVFDFLKDHEGCVAWRPGGEVRLIKFPGGLHALARKHARKGKLSTKSLVDLYLHLCGRRIVTVPKGTYDRWKMVNRNSRKVHRATIARGYLMRCYEQYLDLIERSRQGPIDVGELEERLRQWVRVAFDAAAADADADRLIIDQAVTAWRLPMARLAPPSTFIVVHRDPRDQFVEAKEVLSRPGRRSTTPFDFAATYRQRKRAADRAIPMLEREYGHRFLRMSFEDFVVEHERSAAWLVDQLGLENVRRTGSSFDPAVSRQNVGKHRRELRPTERAVLTAMLLPYLSPHASRSSGSRTSTT
jgi:hypothetical protein